MSIGGGGEGGRGKLGVVCTRPAANRSGLDAPHRRRVKGLVWKWMPSRFPRSSRAILPLSLMPVSATEATCPLTAIRSSKLSNEKSTLPLRCPPSPACSCCYTDYYVPLTRLPLMLLDLGAAPWLLLRLLPPSLPVTLTLTPPTFCTSLALDAFTASGCGLSPVVYGLGQAAYK